MFSVKDGTVISCARAELARALAAILLSAASAAGMAADASVHPELWPQAHSPGLVEPDTEARIGKLLARMSLEDKVGQIIQTDISAVVPEDLARYPLGSILAGGNGGPNGDDRATPQQWLELSRRFHAAALAPRPGHVAIPLMFGIDAVHGHSNMQGAVIFPHNIGLGAARDTELVQRIAAITAEGVAATGIDWTFAPTLAVPQDVRWGRSYEGFSGDPALVREYAKAAVQGLQGPPELAGKLQAGRVAATGKSWVGEGGTVDAIDTGDNRAAERDLIRIHAQGYIAAIDAGVMTLMASYSSWQGVKMHANRPLLTDILKGRLGFEGFVIGDWDGHARVPGCRSDHCPQAIIAGVDMFMAPYHWKELYENTLADVRSGAIPAARLDDAVRRILRVKLKLGLFESDRPYEGRFELLNSSAAHALAREAVRKSLVLLKNRRRAAHPTVGAGTRHRARRRQLADAMRRLVAHLADQRYDQRGLPGRRVDPHVLRARAEVIRRPARRRFRPDRSGSARRRGRRVWRAALCRKSRRREACDLQRS